MTVLTITARGCVALAQTVEALPVREGEGAQRISDALRDCAEHYDSTRIHIELEPDTDSYRLTSAAKKRAELRLVDQPSDLAIVLELAERFLSEGEPLPGLKQIAAVAAIERLKATRPEFA